MTLFSPCKYASPLLAAGLLMVSSAARAQDAAAPTPMFPFVMPWDDASPTITDVSSFNPAPLEEKRRIVARDGHFYDQTGRRVRFLGTNLTFGANFPDKADAEKVAARMRKYGFNMVRLHHMDSRKAPGGIWDPNFADTQHIDAAQLDRLEYLVGQFKKNGIYVDLNLHVSRSFKEADGFPDTDKLPGNGKITGWFEPRMIELQKQYARELLSHLNPYTGQTWAQDPTVALIEINNEDMLLGSMRSGEFEELPDYYRGLVKTSWNAYLKEKYCSSTKLLAAWNAGRPPMGESLLRNARFAEGTQSWRLEQRAPAQGSIEVQDAAGEAPLPAGRVLQVRTTTPDKTEWHLQLHQSDLDLKEGQEYTLSFWARAQEPRRMTLNSKTDQPPWQDTGLGDSIQLTPKWKRYNLFFKAHDVTPGHSRISFILGNAAGDAWLADLSLRANGAFELEAEQSLEQLNLDLPMPSAMPWGLDSTAFLMKLEADYADGMRDYIKKDLGARGLVTCSQANYSGLAGMWRESKTDWIDMHAYWQHPSFPGRPWDPRNWLVPNKAMVADAKFGTIPGLAMNRVEGMPFTVSEYNHPAPNEFTAETMPLIMANAVWQDWDGIFLFDYNGDNQNWPQDKVYNFFSIASHPAKMAFFPAAASLFLSGRNSATSVTKTLVIPKEKVLPLAATYGNYGSIREVWRTAGGEGNVVNERLSVRFVPGNGKLRIEERKRDSTKSKLAWSTGSDPDAPKGLFQWSSPTDKILVRYDAGSPAAAMDGFNFQTTGGGPFYALTLTSKDGRPTRESRSLLLTVAGKVENAGMGWNADRTSVGNQWGEGPSLAEGIAGKVQVQTKAKSAKIFALDGNGSRVREVSGDLHGGHLSFAVGPEYQTVWYEIEAAG